MITLIAVARQIPRKKIIVNLIRGVIFFSLAFMVMDPLIWHQSR